MPFPGAVSQGLRQLNPTLFTANGTIAVPSKARFLHAFIVGGGGGGGVRNAVASSGCGAGGGGCGGSLYARVNFDKFRGSLPLKTSRPKEVTITVGAGGLSSAVSTNTGNNGNSGGASSIAMAGGLLLSVNGAIGGGSNTTTLSARTAGAASITFYQSQINEANDPVIVRALVAAPQQAADAHTGMSDEATGGAFVATVSSESANSGGVISSTILLPWWLQAVGISSLGTGGAGVSAGAGTGHVASGGGGGFGGNGGAGATSNTVGATAGAGTGYGSGGGGASGVGTNTTTSGAGAPGCVVVMFEVEE